MEDTKLRYVKNKEIEDSIIHIIFIRVVAVLLARYDSLHKQAVSLLCDYISNRFLPISPHTNYTILNGS